MITQRGKASSRKMTAGRRVIRKGASERRSDGVVRTRPPRRDMTIHCRRPNESVITAAGPRGRAPPNGKDANIGTVPCLIAAPRTSADITPPNRTTETVGSQTKTAIRTATASEIVGTCSRKNPPSAKSAREIIPQKTTGPKTHDPVAQIVRQAVQSRPIQMTPTRSTISSAPRHLPENQQSVYEEEAQ